MKAQHLRSGDVPTLMYLVSGASMDSLSRQEKQLVAQVCALNENVFSEFQEIQLKFRQLFLEAQIKCDTELLGETLEQLETRDLRT